jgi:archaellum component FlaC
VEDKTFELLTKMYSEFSGRFDGVENRLKKVESLIENDVKKDISALYDGYKQTYEEVVDIKKTANEISSKVEKQDVEIRVIKGGAANA